MQNDRAVRLYLVQKEPKTLKSGGYMQVSYTSEHLFTNTETQQFKYTQNIT